MLVILVAFSTLNLAHNTDKPSRNSRQKRKRKIKFFFKLRLIWEPGHQKIEKYRQRFHLLARNLLSDPPM